MAPSAHRRHKPTGPRKPAGSPEVPSAESGVAAPESEAAAPAASGSEFAERRPPRSKKGGDPERRKEYSIHALLKKITLANKSSASTSNISEVSATASAATEPKDPIPPPSAAAEPAEQCNEELSLFMFDFGECDAKRCSGRRLLRHAKLNKITGTGRVQYAQRAGGRSISNILGDSKDSITSSSSEVKSDAESANIEGEQDESGDESTAEAPVASGAAPPEGPRGGLVRVRVKGGHFKGILLTPYFDKRTQIFSPADAKIMRQHGLAVVDCSWNRVLEGRRSHHIDFVKSNVRILPLLLCGNPTHYGAANILTCAEALAGALYIAGYRRHAEMLLSSFTWGAHFLDLNRRFLEVYVTVHTGQDMRKLKEQQEAAILLQKTEKEQKKLDQDGGYASIYTTIGVASSNEP